MFVLDYVPLFGFVLPDTDVLEAFAADSPVNVNTPFGRSVAGVFSGLWFPSLTLHLAQSDFELH